LIANEITISLTHLFYDMPDFAINLLALPAGLLTCWIAYKLLKNHWEKDPKTQQSEAIDQDLIQ